MKDKLEILKTLKSAGNVCLTYSAPIKKGDRIKIQKSHLANEVFHYIWDDNLEHIESAYLLLLNQSNDVIGYTKLSQGGINGTVLDTRVIMQCVLLKNAVSFILAHNHPSGNLNPSSEDKRMTDKIANAAKLLDLKLIDHLIITSEVENYYSFADEGLL
jgi:DNA repair protein RadC